MANRVVDQLVSEYIARDVNMGRVSDQVEDKLNDVAKAAQRAREVFGNTFEARRNIALIENLQRVRAGFQAAGQAARGAFGPLPGMLARIRAGLTSMVGIAGITVSVEAFSQLGANALRASANLAQTRVTLETLAGSAERAQQKLNFADALARPATFTRRQLREATVTLEAFQLRAERVLPTIAKLGAAFNADDEHLQMLVNMVGRMAAGDMPDMETMSRFGLNRKMFAQEGIQFDGNGKLLSSAQELLSAFERIVEKRYGGILDRMRGLTNTKLASVRDAWEAALEKMGSVAERRLSRPLENLAIIIDRLAENGTFERWAERLVRAGAAVLQVLKLVGAALVAMVTFNVLSGLIRVVQIASAIAKAFGFAAVMAAALQGAARNIRGLVAGIASIIAGVGAYAFLDSKINDIGSALTADPGGSAGAIPSVGGAYSNSGDDTLLSQRPGADDPLGGATGRGKKNPNIVDRMADIMRTMLAHIRMQRASEKLRQLGDPNTRVFERIEDATRRGAKAQEAMLDMSRQVVGGGSIAQNGLSVLDLYQQRTTANNGAYMAGGPARIRLESSTGDPLQRAVQAMIQEAFDQAARQGLFAPPAYTAGY